MLAYVFYLLMDLRAGHPICRNCAPLYSITMYYQEVQARKQPWNMKWAASNHNMEFGWR